MRTALARALAAWLLIGSALAWPVFGQADRDSQDGEVTLETTEVTLDVVVRDKKGRPVTELDQKDFTVYEDGKKQELNSFRLVKAPRSAPRSTSGAEPTAATEGATTTAPRGLTTAPEEMKAIALVFDNLTPEARALAHKAASKYVAENVGAGDAVGVFLVDLTLVSLLPYTTDKTAVAAAVDAAGGRSTAAFTSNSEAIQRLRGSRSGSSLYDVTAQGPSTSAGTDRGEAALNAMNLRAAETFERLERQQKGFATTNSLLGVIEGLKQLPGRKAMLFFSEGVAIPPPVREQFEAVISSANQARVSIYALDARGLRVDNSESVVGREVNSAAAQRIDEIGTPGEGSGRAMLRGLEGVADTMMASPHASLGRLAKATGGYLVSDTNDLAARLSQIDEDLRTYYVVTYTPSNDDYDGSFRKVSVEVKGSGLTVQTREGYYAINAPGSPPVLPYEAPAVAIAVAKKDRSDFAIHALATTFPEPSRPGLSPVMVSVPASAATFMKNFEKKRFATDMTVLVLVRDAKNRIVAKTSKEYILVGPLDDLERTQKGDLLFYDELDLAPGRYEVEAVAYDAPTRKASSLRTPLEVRSHDGGLRLSSVTIVERAEPAADIERKDSPFHVGDALLYPNLGTPVKRSAKGSLAFYVTAYVEDASPTGLDASLEIVQKGRSLARVPLALPAPDADGRIRYTNAIPLAAFKPGEYQLRITLRDSAHSATREASFKIAS